MLASLKPQLRLATLSSRCLTAACAEQVPAHRPQRHPAPPRPRLRRQPSRPAPARRPHHSRPRPRSHSRSRRTSHRPLAGSRASPFPSAGRTTAPASAACLRLSRSSAPCAIGAALCRLASAGSLPSAAHTASRARSLCAACLPGQQPELCGHDEYRCTQVAQPGRRPARTRPAGQRPVTATGAAAPAATQVQLVQGPGTGHQVQRIARADRAGD